MRGFADPERWAKAHAKRAATGFRRTRSGPRPATATADRCNRGHELTPDNAYLATNTYRSRPDGTLLTYHYRRCRQCKRASDKVVRKRPQ